MADDYTSRTTGTTQVEENGVRHDIRTQDDTSGSLSRCWKRASACLVYGLERLFYTLGRIVAKHPKKTICICVVVSLLCSVGALRLHIISDMTEMMLPLQSRMHDERRWIRQNVEIDIRPIRAIVVSDNVLTSRSVQAMLDLYRRIETVRIDSNAHHDNTTSQRGNNRCLDNDRRLEYITGLQDVCSKALNKCLITSLLDLWLHNLDPSYLGNNSCVLINNVLRNITDDDVIRNVNLAKSHVDVSDYLGGITMDTDGSMISARAASITWLLEANSTNVDQVVEFRKAAVKELLKGHPDLQEVNVFYRDAYFDEFFNAATEDIKLIMIGGPLVFIYIVCAMSRPTMIEHGFWLAIAVLSGAGLAACVAYGLCLAVGLMFGVTHQAIMFLFFAIGVDDAFIILETWKRTSRESPNLTPEVTLAETMKHAGVSICVSSLSNCAAFAVGITTTVPVLRSMSVYSVVGVLALLIIQSTLFPACLVLETMRIRDNKNALVVCYKHRKYKANKYRDIEVIEPFFEKAFAPVLLSTPVKVFVLLLTLTFAGVMTWKTVTITKAIDIEQNIIPEGSFASHFFDAWKRYYPEEGISVTLYCGPMDYSRNIIELDRMLTSYENNSDLAKHRVFSWVRPFHQWLQMLKQIDASLTLNSDGFPNTQASFYNYLYQFVNEDPSGAVFRSSLGFHKAFSNITLKWTTYRMEVMFDNHDPSSVDERKLSTLRRISEYSSIEGECFVHSDYLAWIEINAYVDTELIRNIILAGVSIFIITSILIVNLRVSFLVFFCVINTTICLGGVFSIINEGLNGNHVLLITFTIGLSVDFSAHVGYMFMTVTGSRNERAHKTLSKIGPAVFHGAATTLIMFTFVWMANSYSMYLFFLTFTSLVFFGCFHGLCFLPVILSLIGPEPYREHVNGPRWFGEQSRYLLIYCCDLVMIFVVRPVEDQEESQTADSRGHPRRVPDPAGKRAAEAFNSSKIHRGGIN